MKATEAETVTLKLQQQVSGAADAALGALGRLEGQIVREQGALGRLEESLTRARAKLDVLAQGAPDAKAVAAFQKQESAVAALTAELAEAQDTLAIMSQTRVSAETLAAAKGAAEELSTKLVTAKAKMDELKAGTGAQVNVEAYRKQSAAVAAMGDKIGAQKDKLASLKEKFAAGGKGAQSLGDSAKVLGDKLGVTNSETGKLIGMLAKMGPAAAVAAVAILATVAAIGLFVAVIAGAISASGAMRDEQLKLQAATVNSANGFNWLYNSTRASRVGAEQLQEAITKVSGGVALARDKVADYGIQLRKAGFQGKQLETALDAMSIAGAAGGEAMASQFFESARSARFFGQSVDSLAERVKTKLGGVAKAQMLSLGTQMLKLRENTEYMFSGAAIEPFLRGLAAVLSFFNKDEAGAKSLRDMITKFTEMAIGGMLRLGIAIVKTYIAIRTNETAWKAIKLAVMGLVGVAAFFLASMLVGLAPIIGALVLFAAKWILISVAIGYAIKKIGELFGWFKGKNVAEVGKAMVMGIANGIKAGASAIYTALKGAVSSAVDGVVNFLQIGSPSKLLADDVGVHMPGGIAQGNEKAAHLVSDSMKEVAEGGVSAAKGASSGGGSGASSGPVFEFNNCTFGGDLDEGVVRRMMRKVFEAETMAAPEPA